MEKTVNAEELEFVAECQRTKERVAFTMADLYGWDDETVFLDTSIYLNRLKEVNWAIVCKGIFGRRLNPEYNIHIRTKDEGIVQEPLRLLSIKTYSKYRFEAEFSNHIVRTGSFVSRARRIEELPSYVEAEPFCEEDFESAEINPRGIQVKKDIFISAMELWRMSDEYVHYGCNSEDFDMGKWKAIKNIPFLAKPAGGFWASPTRSGGRRTLFDWETFCNTAEYEPRGGLFRKFYFCVDINANVFTIANADDYNALPKISVSHDTGGRSEVVIDFEECVRQGIDAIVYDYSAVHRDKDICDEMDIRMLGWDCDSILIMNPDIILQDSFLSKSTYDFLVKG